MPYFLIVTFGMPIVTFSRKMSLFTPDKLTFTSNCIRLNITIEKRGLLYMIIYELLDSLVMTLGHAFKYPVIYRPWLRFNVFVTMLIAAVVYGIDSLVYTSISPVSENSACLLGTWLLAEIVNILMVRKDKIIDMLILEYFYQFIYNVIGTGLIALNTIIYGIISGAATDMWFSRQTLTDSDYVIRIISAAICFTISLMICRKVSVIMANMQKKLKLLLFFGMVVPMAIFMVIKNVVILTTENMLQGPLVVLYGILLMWVSVCLLIFFVSVFMQTKENNRLIQARIESQNMHYHRVLKAQQELREAKHDLANRLAAYNIAQTNRDR